MLVEMRDTLAAHCHGVVFTLSQDRGGLNWNRAFESARKPLFVPVKPLLQINIAGMPGPFLSRRLLHNLSSDFKAWRSILKLMAVR